MRTHSSPPPRRGLAAVLAVAALAAPASAQAPAPGAQRLALVGGRIYSAPGQPPIAKGVVLIEGTRITAVGAQGKLAIPPGTKVLTVSGAAVFAGFWNSHVHFAERKWSGAGSIPAGELVGQLQQMLTRYGFTSVFDTGSDWTNTKRLRSRIESDEVAGPRILSAGGVLFPKAGLFPADLLLALGFTADMAAMPEIETPAQGAEAVQRQIEAGVDAIKVYAATWRPPFVAVPAETVRAVAAAAHEGRLPVLVHPSNSEGLRAAIENGADVVVHTTPGMLFEARGPAWTDAEIALMLDKKIALIPTLKLWRWETRHDRRSEVEPFVQAGVEQLRAFARAGGTVLFGTDVGYMDDYDPTEEYRLMAEAGLSFEQILASLTVNPAGRFAASDAAGRIAPGAEADLVVLDGDPARDVGAFARVRYTVRRGRVIYARPESAPAR